MARRELLSVCLSDCTAARPNGATEATRETHWLPTHGAASFSVPLNGSRLDVVEPPPLDCELKGPSLFTQQLLPLASFTSLPGPS